MTHPGNVEIKLVRGGPGGEHHIATIKGVKMETIYAAFLLAGGIANKGFPNTPAMLADLLDDVNGVLDGFIDTFG